MHVRLSALCELVLTGTPQGRWQWSLHLTDEDTEDREVE